MLVGSGLGLCALAAMFFEGALGKAEFTAVKPIATQVKSSKGQFAGKNLFVEMQSTGQVVCGKSTNASATSSPLALQGASPDSRTGCEDARAADVVLYIPNAPCGHFNLIVTYLFREPGV